MALITPNNNSAFTYLNKQLRHIQGAFCDSFSTLRQSLRQRGTFSFDDLIDPPHLSSPTPRTLPTPPLPTHPKPDQPATVQKPLIDRFSTPKHIASQPLYRHIEPSTASPLKDTLPINIPPVSKPTEQRTSVSAPSPTLTNAMPSVKSANLDDAFLERQARIQDMFNNKKGKTL